MWGIDRRLLSPVYDKTRPVPPHLMNVLGKPDFQQKYKALPVIPDHYNEVLESATYNESKVNVVHQEYATGRSGTNPSHMSTQNKELINQIPTKLTKKKSNTKKKQKSVPEVSNPILGPISRPLVPYNSDIKAAFTSVREIANRACVDRTFLGGTVRDLSLYGKQSVIPGITQRGPNLEQPRDSTIERVQSNLTIQKTPVDDFNMQKTCLLEEKVMLKTKNLFGKQSVIPGIAKKDKTPECLSNDIIERVQSSQDPVLQHDKKLELETKTKAIHTDVESEKIEQTQNLYGKQSVLPETTSHDEDNCSNSMINRVQSKFGPTPNNGPISVKLNMTHPHGKKQVLPRIAPSNPYDDDYSTASNSSANIDDHVFNNIDQYFDMKRFDITEEGLSDKAIKPDENQSHNDSIPDVNRTGQTYKRREFMREDEPVSLNIACSYESSPREKSVSVESDKSISKDNIKSIVQENHDNAQNLETKDCESPECISASSHNNTATHGSAKLKKSLPEKERQLMRKYESAGKEKPYSYEISPREKSLSVFDMERLDIAEEGLGDKSNKLFQSQSHNDSISDVNRTGQTYKKREFMREDESVSLNIACSYESSPREKSVSVESDKSISKDNIKSIVQENPENALYTETKDCESPECISASYHDDTATHESAKLEKSLPEKVRQLMLKYESAGKEKPYSYETSPREKSLSIFDMERLDIAEEGLSDKSIKLFQSQSHNDSISDVNRTGQTYKRREFMREDESVSLNIACSYESSPREKSVSVESDKSISKDNIKSIVQENHDNAQNLETKDCESPECISASSHNNTATHGSAKLEKSLPEKVRQLMLKYESAGKEKPYSYEISPREKSLSIFDMERLDIAEEGLSDKSIKPDESQSHNDSISDVNRTGQTYKRREFMREDESVSLNIACSYESSPRGKSVSVESDKSISKDNIKSIVQENHDNAQNLETKDCESPECISASVENHDDTVTQETTKLEKSLPEKERQLMLKFESAGMGKVYSYETSPREKSLSIFDMERLDSAERGLSDKAIKPEPSQSRNDSISDVNKTGQTYERREFMREDESVSLNIACSYETSPREKYLSIFDMERLDITEEGLSDKSIKLGQSQSHNDSVSDVNKTGQTHESRELVRKYGHISMNNAASTNEKSLSVNSDINTVNDGDSVFSYAGQSNVASEYKHTTSEREKPKCPIVSKIDIADQDNGTGIKQDVVSSVSGNVGESFKREDECTSWSKIASERSNIANSDIINKENESLNLGIASACETGHSKIGESLPSVKGQGNVYLEKSYSDRGNAVDTNQSKKSELSATVDKCITSTWNVSFVNNETNIKERTFAIDAELNGETMSVNKYTENDDSATQKDEDTAEDRGSNNVHSISHHREQIVTIVQNADDDNTQRKASHIDDLSIKRSLIILADPEHVRRKHRKRKADREKHIKTSSDKSSSTKGPLTISTKLSSKEQNEKKRYHKTSSTTVEASDTDEDIIKVPDDILDEVIKSEVGSEGLNETAQSVDCQVIDMWEAYDTSPVTPEQDKSNDKREEKDTPSETSHFMNMGNADSLREKHVKRVTFAETPHIYHIKSISALKIELRGSDDGSNDYDTDEDIEHISDNIFDDGDGDVAIIEDVPIQVRAGNTHSGMLPELARQIRIDGKLMRPESKSDTSVYLTERRNVETQTTFTVQEDIGRRQNQRNVIRNSTRILPRIVKDMHANHTKAEGDPAPVSAEERSYFKDSKPRITETHNGDGTTESKNMGKEIKHQGKSINEIVNHDLNLQRSNTSKKYKQIKPMEKCHRDVEDKSNHDTSLKSHKPIKGDLKTLQINTTSKYKYRKETQNKVRRELSWKSTQVIPDLLTKTKSMDKKGCKESDGHIKYDTEDGTYKIWQCGNKSELQNPTKSISKNDCSNESDFKSNEKKNASNQRSNKSIKKSAKLPHENDIHVTNDQNNTRDNEENGTHESNRDFKSSKSQIKQNISWESERKVYNNIKSTDSNKTNIHSSYDKNASKEIYDKVTTPRSTTTRNSVNMNTIDTKIASEIYSDLSTRCKIRSEIYSDLSTRCRTKSKIYPDLSTRCRIRSEIHPDLSTRCRIRSEIYPDLSTRCRTKSEIHADLSTRCKIKSEIYSDLSTRCRIRSEIHPNLSTRCKTIPEMLDNLNKTKYGLQHAYVVNLLEENKYAELSKLIANPTDPTLLYNESMAWHRYKLEQLRTANGPNVTASAEDKDRYPSLYSRQEHVIKTPSMTVNICESTKEITDIGSGYICCYGKMKMIASEDTITQDPCHIRHSDTAKRGKPKRKLGDRIRSFFRNLVCIGKPKTDE